MSILTENVITNAREPKQVLVLLSDTGGGHRAAAEAIRAAAAERYPGAFNFRLVDVFRGYTPPPFKNAPELYPLWVNHAAPLWELSYNLTDNLRLSRLLVRWGAATLGGRLRRILADCPSDLILNVHSIIGRPALQAFQRLPQRPPFMTVVTDLVSTHAFWYDRGVERCLVPTGAAYERGLYYGMEADQMRVTGLPIHPNFLKKLTTKAEARHELGLDPHRPTVLLVSGGEGMGPLFRIATAINARGLDCQLLIVAGRNEALKARLEAQTWHQPTRVFGFVDNMPQLMAAADVLITKAGPATITEACTVGLPIILSGALPGQEDGNVRLVVENGVGVYAPHPQQVAETLAAWLRDKDGLAQRAECAKLIARPGAVWDIVDEVYELAQKPLVQPQNQPEYDAKRSLFRLQRWPYAR